MTLKSLFARDSDSKTELDRLQLSLRDSCSGKKLEIVENILNLGDSNRRIQNMCIRLCISYLQELKSKENRERQEQVLRLIAEKFMDERKSWKKVTLDLSQVSLHCDLPFSGLNFSGCVFVFEGLSLRSVNLDFSKSRFEGCNFNFRSVILEDVKLSFEDATFASKEIWQAFFIDLGKSRWHRSNISMTNAKIRNVSLSTRSCYLNSSILCFVGARLDDCNLDFSMSELSLSEILFQSTNCANTNVVLAGVNAVQSVFNASDSKMSESCLVFGESKWSKSTVIMTGQTLENSMVSLRKTRHVD